ncbi:hypothetical protein GQ55_2G461500 [Panicum hallii var. hallii]|uniref:Uncharacterized protein n=1 Tax=Panicum hallii var. hallii TaxID=1504633 RepID=A0A2T7EZL9_9POAL|nr:hypothetical protein GQ55_2G461500 [Panicum hallii var. hallii]
MRMLESFCLHRFLCKGSCGCFLNKVESDKIGGTPVSACDCTACKHGHCKKKERERLKATAKLRSFCSRSEHNLFTESTWAVVFSVRVVRD